jgi:hypothetical protein
MEVGQGPNEGCSAKEKKKVNNILLINECSSFVFFFCVKHFVIVKEMGVFNCSQCAMIGLLLTHHGGKAFIFLTHSVSVLEFGKFAFIYYSVCSRM